MITTTLTERLADRGRDSDIEAGWESFPKLLRAIPTMKSARATTSRNFMPASASCS